LKFAGSLEVAATLGQGGPIGERFHVSRCEVMRLREKVDANFEPKLLHTVRGTGYVLKEGP